MLDWEPGRTAFAAAALHAAHQVLVDPDHFRQNPELREARRGIRFSVAARSGKASKPAASASWWCLGPGSTPSPAAIRSVHREVGYGCQSDP
jgi:hypothetical protein